MTTPPTPAGTAAADAPVFETTARPAIPAPTYQPSEQVTLSSEDLEFLLDIKHTKVIRAQDVLASAQREVETVQKLINLATQGNRVVAHPAA